MTDDFDTKVYCGPESTIRVSREPSERPACVDAFGELPDGCPGWCPHARPLSACLRAAAAPTDPFGEGAKLPGGLRLVQHIASGSMGSVFAAHDPCLGRDVAVKVLRTRHFCDAAARERFVLEARAMARVVHDNVVQILSWGHASGWPYFVMEYIDGTDLGRILKATPGHRLPRARALEVLEAMADGLQAIHGAGAIHNDIKPSNVLIGVDGRVAIADFGLARPMSAVCRIDRREIAGTPAYMAPEVARGKEDRPNPAIDIYALGVVAFRMLTGQLPFTHRTPRRVMVMQAKVAPPRPSRVQPLLPRAFDAPLLAALSKDPAQRPASALEFVDRLREADARCEAEPEPGRFTASRLYMVG